MRIINGQAALVVRPKGVELIDVPETADAVATGT